MATKLGGFNPTSLKFLSDHKEHMPVRFELEIIDIYQQPIFAKEGQIVAAPMLVKAPPLLRKFIGDLS